MNKSQYDNLNSLCEALESGLYLKGKRYLRGVGDKYCCMGVALNIVDPDGWVARSACHDHRLGSEYNSSVCENGVNGGYYLSKEARDLFGFTEDDQTTLTSMNDSHDSFRPIIKHIREEILTRRVEENSCQA